MKPSATACRQAMQVLSDEHIGLRPPGAMGGILKREIRGSEVRLYSVSGAQNLALFDQLIARIAGHPATMTVHEGVIDVQVVNDSELPPAGPRRALMEGKEC